MSWGVRREGGREGGRELWLSGSQNEEGWVHGRCFSQAGTALGEK